MPRRLEVQRQPALVAPHFEAQLGLGFPIIVSRVLLLVSQPHLRKRVVEVHVIYPGVHALVVVCLPVEVFCEHVARHGLVEQRKVFHGVIKRGQLRITFIIARVAFARVTW